jgi:hypothetical protein
MQSLNHQSLHAISIRLESLRKTKREAERGGKYLLATYLRTHVSSPYFPHPLDVQSMPVIVVFFHCLSVYGVIKSCNSVVSL